MKKQKRSQAERTAIYGVLVALAFIFSYIETLIPISIGVPGVKLGLANLVVLAALYLMQPADAFIISVVRILLVGFTFSNLSAMLYSLAGGMLSFFLMVVCKRKEWFGITGVSIVGGVSHNIGQLLMAAVVLENHAVFFYLPVLLLAGAVTGAVMGLLGGAVWKRISKIW